MTILEIAGSSRMGGVETYLLRLAAHLENNGHRVVFVTRRDAPLSRETRARGLATHDFFRGGKNPLTVLKLALLMRRERVDLVHTHLFSANTLGAIAAKWAGIPSIARVPATEGAEHYRRSTYVTAVSHNVAAHLESQGFPPGKIRVFYNGVDWARFDELPPCDELPPRDAARQKLGLPPDAFVVLCAASLTPRKGQKFLLQASAEIRPEIHLLLCGEGKEEMLLRELATELKMGNRVHFAGFLSDIRPALAASDVFALPSLQEGLPNVVMEALAARVPTIATHIAGTPEIIENGKTGILIAPGEVVPLRISLETLQRDPELRARLARAGRQKIERDFDGRACLSQIEAFFVAVDAAWKNGRQILPAGAQNP